MAELLDPTSLRRHAAAIGLKPTKALGQNFVVDANTVRRIVSLAGVKPGEQVLEIGPGLGSLTLGLLAAGAGVIAVEIDDALAKQLPLTVAEHQPNHSDMFQVMHDDALRVSKLPEPQPDRIVANLPYNVSVPVLLHVLERFMSCRQGLVMVQQEVAERLVAGPGSRVYGVPSAKLAWYADARIVGKVPPGVFWPVPNVDSGLVYLERVEPPATTATKEQVFTVIDAAFSQRRKMLRSALSGLAGSSAATSAAIESAGLDPTSRGESLSVAMFAAIAEQLF